jgi:hypothetical protein
MTPGFLLVVGHAHDHHPVSITQCIEVPLSFVALVADPIDGAEDPAQQAVPFACHIDRLHARFAGKDTHLFFRNTRGAQASTNALASSRSSIMPTTEL